MTRNQEIQFYSVESNSFEFYRLRAKQERQNAIKDFFGSIFGSKTRN